MWKKKNNKKIRLIFVVIGFLFLVIGLVFLIINDSSQSENFVDRGLPILNIELSGVSLDDINLEHKDIRYYNNKITIYNKDKQYNFQEVEIKGRGNATWSMAKKPYQLKVKNKINMLSFGKTKKWYLLANINDETNLRNDIAFYFEKMLGMDYVLGGEFVELYVDNEYVGLYYMTNAMEISKQSVDLKNPNGILVELDNVYGSYEEFYWTNDGNMLVIKDLVNKDNEQEAMTEFLASFNNLEKAVKNKNYDEVKKIIDVDSWVKYYLLSEFTVNPDAYWTSYYFYKDGLDDKIHAGPGWDFDMSLGNRNWQNWMGEEFYSPTETLIRKKELELFKEDALRKDDEEYLKSTLLSTIMFNLTEFSEFREKIDQVFVEKLSGRKDELIGNIRLREKEIHEAALVNAEKWSEKNYEREVENLINWIVQRYDYFEKVYGVDGKKKYLDFL